MGDVIKEWYEEMIGEGWNLTDPCIVKLKQAIAKELGKCIIFDENGVGHDKEGMFWEIEDVRERLGIAVIPHSKKGCGKKMIHGFTCGEEDIVRKKFKGKHLCHKCRRLKNRLGLENS